MPPSRVGTINPLDDTTRTFVDEDLQKVAPGSPEAAFVFKNADLDRIRKRRAELGLTGDEAKRVQVASHKVALADAERRAAAAEAEVETLKARVAEGEKAEKKAAAKAGADEPAEK